MLGKEGVSVPQRGLGAGAGGQGAGLLGCGLGSGRILGIGGKAYAQRKAEDKQQAGKLFHGGIPPYQQYFL